MDRETQTEGEGQVKTEAELEGCVSKPKKIKIKHKDQGAREASLEPLEGASPSRCLDFGQMESILDPGL